MLLAVGDTILETPTVLRSRQYETGSYRALLSEYFESGAKWLAAPRRLDGSYIFWGGGHYALDESEPIVDAAPALRIGRNILYQVSCSGNRSGGRWLQSPHGEHALIHASCG